MLLKCPISCYYFKFGHYGQPQDSGVALIRPSNCPREPCLISPCYAYPNSKNNVKSLLLGEIKNNNIFSAEPDVLLNLSNLLLYEI